MNKFQNFQYEDLINGNLSQMKESFTTWTENMKKHLHLIQHCKNIVNPMLYISCVAINREIWLFKFKSPKMKFCDKTLLFFSAGKKTIFLSQDITL